MADSEETGQQTLDSATVANEDWRKKPGRFILMHPISLDGTASKNYWIFEPIDGSGKIKVSPEDVPDFAKEEVHQNILSGLMRAFEFWLDLCDPQIRQWFWAAVGSDSPEAKELREAIMASFFKSQ